MEAPPPYVTQKPKKTSGLVIGLVIAAVALCCCGPLALLGGGYFFGMNVGNQVIPCSLAFTNVSKALKDYANDHGGKLPKAETWMDDVRSYYKKEAEKKTGLPFKVMPAEGDWGCTTGDQRTGITFNSSLAGKKLDSIKDKDTPLVFETPTIAANSHAPYKELDISKSPKYNIMGKTPNRGWYVSTVGGDTYAIGENGQKIRFSNSGGPGGFQVKTDD